MITAAELRGYGRARAEASAVMLEQIAAIAMNFQHDMTTLTSKTIHGIASLRLENVGQRPAPRL